jgi:16S rRNA C967 or C1407 C5-methylase (RsmB/RsmF family)
VYPASRTVSAIDEQLKRLDALTGLVERSGAKLIAVGDGKQLPSIGPGGMFDRLTDHAPTVALAGIHRTKDPADPSAPGKHYARENPSARWRTTPHTARCTSPTPATKPQSTPYNMGRTHGRTRYPRGRADR